MNWENIFITNLNLLGFNTEQLEKTCRVKFAKGLFASPNRKALELFFYFLFENLDINKCSKVFCDCFPVLTKKQESVFTRAANSWLTEISMVAGLPNYSPSLLISPRGEQIYELLSKLSTFVMSKKIVSDFSIQSSDVLKQPTIRGEKLSLLLKTNLHRELSEFLQNASLATKEFREFQILMRDLVEEHHHLIHICNDFDEQMKDLHRNSSIDAKNKGRPFTTVLSSTNVKPSESDHYMKFRNHRVQKLMYQWNMLQTRLSNLSHERAVVDEILNKPNNSTILNAKDINLSIPDALYSGEGKTKLHDNVITGGKLNLEMFFGFGNAAVIDLNKNLDNMSINFADDADSSTTTETKLLSTVNRHESLLDQLEEVMHSLEFLLAEVNEFSIKNANFCSKAVLPEEANLKKKIQTSFRNLPTNFITKLEDNYIKATDWNGESTQLNFKTPVRPPPKSRFTNAHKYMSTGIRIPLNDKSEKNPETPSRAGKFIPLDFSAEQKQVVDALLLNVLSPMSFSDTCTTEEESDGRIDSLALSHSPMEGDTSSVTSLTNQNEDNALSSSLLPYLVATPCNSTIGERSSVRTRIIGPEKHFSLEMDSGSSVDEDNNWMKDVTDSLPPPHFSQNWMRSPTEELYNGSDFGVEDVSDSFLVL